MRRFTAALIIFISILAMFSFVSCKEEVIDSGYSTPTIKGKVSIPSGSNLSGSDFYIQVMDGDNAVYTGNAESDGTFVVSGLDATKSYDVLVTTEPPKNIVSKSLSRDISTEYGGWLSSVTAAVGEANNVGSVMVKPLGTIKGKVSIDDIANTAVFVYVPGTSYIGITDEEGNFSISNMAQATYRLRFMADGYMAKVVEDIVLYADDDTTPPEKAVETVTLVKKVGVVEGFAVLDGVADSSGIGIRLEAEDGTNYAALTSITGAYRIENVVPGSYRIIASYANYPSVSSGSIDVEAGKTTIMEDKITLIENYGVVKGTAGLADSDVVSGISILFTNKATGYSYSTVTGIDGSFSKQVKPGEYSVVASYANHESQTMDVTVVIDSTISVELPKLALSSGSVNGKVLLEGETNYTGATVAAIQTSDEAKSYTTTTLEDGSYYIGGILPGTYSIQIQKSGFVTDRSQTAVVSGGNSTSVNSVTLSSTTSTVKGTVTLDGSNDNTGITILLKPAEEGTQYNTSTDQSGNYTLTKVIPGNYVLYASKAGYETKTVKDLTVESSVTKTIDTQNLSVAIRSITGSVELELKDDHAGALVTATNCSDPTDIYSAITNTSGSYTLAGMKPGEYEIVISYTGYRSVTLPTVNVVSDSTVDNGLTDLSINRGTIYGKATLEGRTSSAGVKVDLYKGTELYETKYTDEVGSYSFYVPQGNYSGVLFSMEDFRSESDQEAISLFAEGQVSIAAVELEATHNTVKGVADVLTTDDDSAVTISFDNHSELGSFVSMSDGVFQFDHVPVGSYTFRFERDNCSDIILPVEVIAADEINVGTVKITPNTGSITGKVSLENGTSLSGVRVEVDMGTETLSTTTDSSGRYEIGGISIADVYTVTYSKDGWDSKTQQISPALTKLEVREMDEITLVDTTAPVLNSVVINSGANTAADRHITLHFYATEFGSGISKVMITYDNVFDRTVTRYDYIPSMDWDLPSGNGEKEIYVCIVDEAGNVSESVSSRVVLTDQKYELSSVLDSEDELHLTKERSPYLVIGNLMVEEESTLIIDAGVDIQFAGPYSLQIEGKILVNGEEDNPVKFYGVDEGVDSWNGINGVYDNENTLRNVSITDMETGCIGFLNIYNSEIMSRDDGNALVDLKGNVFNCIINGRIEVNSGNFANNTVASTSGSFNDSIVVSNQFYGGNIYINCTGASAANNLFQNLNVSISAILKHTTFVGCNLSEMNGTWSYCSLEDCTGMIFRGLSLTHSNINNCSDLYISSQRSSIQSTNMTNNFWGYDKTKEMMQSSDKDDLSFIIDYYDNFDLSKVLWSGFVEDPFADVGYQGSSYDISGQYNSYSIGDTGPAGGYIVYDKGFYSDGWRYIEVAPYDLFQDEDGTLSVLNADGESKFIFGNIRTASNGTNLYVNGTTEYNLFNCTTTGVGAGKRNTELLVDSRKDVAYGWSSGSDRTSIYAARLCSELSYTYNGVFYDDWQLPSRDELNLLYNKLYRRGIGNFKEDWYWTSSEDSPDNGWVQNFDESGLQSTYNYYGLASSYLVRPIRYL